MSTYIVGDIQGCLDPLLRLLDTIAFDPTKDTLWSVGDIVNRGPQSLETLRYVKSLGTSFQMVLGNHDLHLLAVSNGQRQAKRSDTLDSILNAPDRDELLLWLRHQPLIHHDKTSNSVLVHAGLPHMWGLNQTLSLAHEVESALQGEQHAEFFTCMYGDQPEVWHDDLQGMERLRLITNYLTRMRVCDGDGRLNLTFKGPKADIPSGLKPWFAYHKKSSVKIYFGHWAALGTQTIADHIYALDSGCVWGGELTAIRREDGKRFSCACNT